MIRPAKIFEAAVKHQTEQNKRGFSADDVVNPSDAPAEANSATANSATANSAMANSAEADGVDAAADTESKAHTADGTAGKKKKFKVPSVRPKIGTVL